MKQRNLQQTDHIWDLLLLKTYKIRQNLLFFLSAKKFYKISYISREKSKFYRIYLFTTMQTANQIPYFRTSQKFYGNYMNSRLSEVSDGSLFLGVSKDLSIFRHKDFLIKMFLISILPIRDHFLRLQLCNPTFRMSLPKSQATLIQNELFYYT